MSSRYHGLLTKLRIQVSLSRLQYRENLNAPNQRLACLSLQIAAEGSFSIRLAELSIDSRGLLNNALRKTLDQQHQFEKLRQRELTISV